MNMKKHFGFILLSVLTLTSCTRFGFSSSSTSASSSFSSNSTTSSDTTSSLEIKSLPETYYYDQYDSFSSKGLVVFANTYKNNKLISSEEITDYTIIDSKNEIVNSSYRFFTTAENGTNLYVTKEGYTPAAFEIFVEASTITSETLSVSSSNKSLYYINDSFLPSDLSIKYIARYKGSEKTKRFSETVDTSKLTISVKNGNDSITYPSLSYTYKFEKIGFYTISLSYKGYKSNVSTSYGVTVVSEDSVDKITSLPKYTDSSISMETDTKKMKVSFTNSNKELDEGDKGYYSPDEVINKYNIADFSKRNFANWHYTPSTGEVPLLVIPIITPGDENKATEANWNLINKAFFGNSSDLYFESLHSYYYKSSYGQLDIKGGVTGYFDPSSVSSTYSSINNYTSENISSLVSLAWDWAKSTYNLKATDYDSDGDGYIDGIWLIYMHETDSSTNFWGYTSTTTSSNGTASNPVVNTFGWASIDFINDKFISYNNSSLKNYQCDAHVLIHETGHMLGLSDYYSYNYYGTYNAVGTVDMMSQNLGDQNMYSKMLLGWVTPYIVYGDCEITLSSSQEKDQVIVIPYDDKEYSKDSNGKILFNVFDEYLVLDYYSDKNLNSSDYDCYDATHVSGDGGRLYHVDNRLFKLNFSSASYSFDVYSDVDAPFTTNTSDSFYRIINNSESGDNAESYYGVSTDYNVYDEIRWISANKYKLSQSTKATNSSLFKANSSFSIASFSSQFNSKTTSGKTTYLNNKKTLSTSFKISSIS